jgi:hypothetical protein
MIIPIGIDNTIADFLKENHLQHLALPFDRVITYGGVANCIKDYFSAFIPQIVGQGRTRQYNVAFPNDFKPHLFDSDIVNYTKRINTFMSILDTCQEEIIFCRKSHSLRDCGISVNDLADAEELDRHLAAKYPQLKYKIYIFQVCTGCSILAATGRIFIYKMPEDQLSRTLSRLFLPGTPSNPSGDT